MSFLPASALITFRRERERVDQSKKANECIVTKNSPIRFCWRKNLTKIINRQKQSSQCKQKQSTIAVRCGAKLKQQRRTLLQRDTNNLAKKKVLCETRASYRSSLKKEVCVLSSLTSVF